MTRSRQQWAIGLTGVGAMLLASVLVFGGPVFEFSCTGSECDETLGDFLFWVAWSFFAVSFGTIALVTGIVLFVIDGAQRQRDDADEE